MSSNSDNKKLSRSEAEQLIYPKTDYIDEQIDIILMDISDNLKNGEFLNDVIYVHELGLLLKQSFKAENIIIKWKGKVRSISWYLRYWHDGLLNYISKKTKMKVEKEDNDYKIYL